MEVLIVTKDKKHISNEFNNKKPNAFYLIIKRFFDIICSIIGLVFLVPIIIIIKAIYICSGDFHSIFYSQMRIGKKGKIFRLYKFRSMIVNADEELERILKEDKKLAEEYRINKKLEDDPRITNVGKIIRRTSIDELPQLLNILFGQMSFIGNRPYLPKEKNDMNGYFGDIVKTKPGLSGYWQVSLRSRGTFEERLKMEQYYSNNANLWFDIKILFKTFGAVFGGEGAK